MSAPNLAESWCDDLVLIVSVAGLLSQLDLPAMLERIERAHALGPMLDPTLYRAKAKAMDEDAELIRAALPLWRHAQKMLAAKEAKP